MSNIDAVVELAQEYMSHGRLSHSDSANHDAVRGLVRDLLAAYQSAVQDKLGLAQEVLRADNALWKHRSALSRIRESVEQLDGGTIHANGRQFASPDAVSRTAVLALFDRESA